MPLNLNELLKKAESKGITQKQNLLSPAPQLLRPWQQESVLYTSQQHEPNLGQSEAKQSTKLSQIQDKVKPKLSQPMPKLEPIHEPNLGQSEAKNESKIHFTSLVGLQRKIVLYIHEICQTILEQRTHPLSVEFISTHCQSTKSAVRKAIQRLEQKKMVIRSDFKNGRGGWTRYQLTDHLYQEVQRIKNHKLEPNLSQSEAKVGTELRPNPYSSSSYNINNKTTTSHVEEDIDTLSLSSEWETIDITPLAEIGFSKHYLNQIIKRNVLSAAIVQESINAFAFDLKINRKKFDISPINYFMGVVGKGRPYMPPHNYESEQSRAMRMYLEKKRELTQKDAALEEELLNESFNDWKNNLSEKELNDLLPDEIKDSRLTGAKTAHLRSYYKKEFWPKKRQEIIKISA